MNFESVIETGEASLSSQIDSQVLDKAHVRNDSQRQDQLIGDWIVSAISETFSVTYVPGKDELSRPSSKAVSTPAA
jgi:hypothetical protein